MPSFKFEEYVFDSEALSLERQGYKVVIRPKTLKLLDLLIQNRHRLVSKPEIMMAIWGSTSTPDYLLFQLVSELRKLSSKDDLVRTQPNEGYQWTVTTNILKNEVKMFYQLTACAVVCVFCVMTFLSLDLSNSKLEQISRLPAHNAFSKGVTALEHGNPEKAIKWFEFALQENPDSTESLLFLAETLYVQNKPDESSMHLRNLLHKPNLDAYSQMTATDLLSQISQRQGHLGDALYYAKQSAQQSVLISEIGQCSAEVVDGRIQMLEKILLPGSVIASDNANKKNEVPKNKQEMIVKIETSNSKNYEKLCKQLKNKPLKVSYCEASAFRGLYAYSQRGKLPYNS
jgi:DNA-binding winged helix-turn-helix (wHTH) protein